MPTINQLSAVDQINDGDQFPLYSPNAGDARKASFTTVKKSLAGDFASLADLAAQTGAGLVGTSGGTTVQQALDSKPTATLDTDGTLAANSDGRVASQKATKTYVDVYKSAVAATSGSSLVGFLQSGTGAASRTAQTKLRDAIHIKDFGAVCDGVANDYTAFANAIAYLASIGGGKLCLSGKILLNSTVNITSSGIVIEGDGHQSTWIVNGQANQPAIKFGDGINTYNRNGLHNVIFGQKSGVAAVSGNCGLYVSKCSNFVLNNVQCFQFPGSLYDGVIFDQVTQSYMSNIGLQACLNRALYMFNQTFDIYMVNGRCDSSAYGIEFRDCQGIQGANWTAYANTVNAYRFTTSGSTDNNQFFFLTNWIGDTSGQHNWKIEQLSLATLTNCWAATQLTPISGGNYDGFYLSGGDVEDLQFNNCIAIGNNRHGMNIDYANRIQINGGMYGSNFKPSAFGGLGARNGLAGAGSGLYISGICDRISVNGGKFEHNKDYGIDIASGATKVEILGSETRFNVSGGALRNLANGTNPEARIKDVAGYNPLGFISAPAVPASGTAITNLSGVDAMVYLVGGTLTGNVEINGHGVLSATNTGYYLPAGATIKLNYSVAPGWSWNGL